MFRRAIRLLPTIACVRLADVTEAYRQLEERYFPDDQPENEVDEDLRDIYDYFKRTYIGSPGRPPLVKRELWNVHDRIVGNWSS